MAQQYFDLIHQRRTYYSLTNTSHVPDSRIIEIVHEAVRNSPSSLNGRTSRVVVLLGDEHRKLWDIALDALKGILSVNQWKVYEKKLSDRKAAYGTVSDILTTWLLKSFFIFLLKSHFDIGFALRGPHRFTFPRSSRASLCGPH